MTQMLDMSDGLFEELADVVVVEVIDDLPPLAPADDQAQVTQNAKLVRDGRGLHPHRGCELVDRRPASVELAEDAQPAGCRECLHRLGDRLREPGIKLRRAVLIASVSHKTRIAERIFRHHRFGAAA